MVCSAKGDVEADPIETKNLAGEATRVDQLQRHRQWLAQWRKTTEEDQYPLTASPGKPKPKAKRQAQAKPAA